MKNFKRVISILLVVATLFTSLAVFASAKNTTYTQSFGKEVKKVVVYVEEPKNIITRMFYSPKIKIVNTGVVDICVVIEKDPGNPTFCHIKPGSSHTIRAYTKHTYTFTFVNESFKSGVPKGYIVYDKYMSAYGSYR